MIKAIITDVDGVIVGDKEGINFPLPNKRVIQRLKEINQTGIPIILCTGKPKKSIEEIIKAAQLDNPHISDAGAYIYNPLRDEVVNEHTIPTLLVKQIVKACLEKNLYVEIHEATGYYIQKDQQQSLTAKRTIILQQEPKIVDSLIAEISQRKIIKILPFIDNEKEKARIEEILEPVVDKIHAFWSTVPFMLPVLAKVITAKGVSKMYASQEVLDYLQLSFNDCLGVGDLPPDWLFIKHCLYGGAVGNIDSEFKKNIKSKGKGNYFFGRSVDEDGFIEILNYFIK